MVERLILMAIPEYRVLVTATTAARSATLSKLSGIRERKRGGLLIRVDLRDAVALQGFPRADTEEYGAEASRRSISAASAGLR